MAAESGYVEVQVEGVGQNQINRSVVVLRDTHDRRLHIWIGHCEAMAIAQRLDEDFEAQRPLTQDLALNLWRKLGGELTQLRIDDFWESVYYSKLTVLQHGERVDIDCRPSDGLALALAAGVPIYVAEQVMLDADAAERGEADDDE